MRDGRPNPDIWGNIITCGEIAVGLDQAVGWEYSANSDSFGWKNVCSVLCLQIVIYRLSSHIIQRLLTNGRKQLLSLE